MPGATAIECESLSRFYGTMRALDDVSFSVSTGDVVALIGPNGAGKSTLIELIAGLQTPTVGAVRVLGGTPREAVSAGAIGTMLQDGALLRAGKVKTLLKLMLGLQRRPVDMQQLIARANIASIVDKSVSKLSGGEAQRVRYALAIMSDSKILMLDEPTVGLDVEARKAFWEDIRARRDQQTIFYTTHNLDEADRWAERVLVVSNGKLVADATPLALRESFGFSRIEFQAAPSLTLPALSTVARVEHSGDRFTIWTTDSDATLAELTRAGVPLKNLQIGSSSLEDSFENLLHAQPTDK